MRPFNGAVRMPAWSATQSFAGHIALHRAPTAASVKLHCSDVAAKERSQTAASFTSVSGGWRPLADQLDAGEKAHGMRSSIRFAGWPAAIASRVDFI